MTDKEYPSNARGQSIDPETAFQHAVLGVRQAAASGVEDFAKWGRADVDREPLRLDDLNGEPLFYDFNVGKVGVVRTSANSIVGSPVVSMQLGARTWSAEDAKTRAVESASKVLGSKATATSLVCYSYPKIGVRVHGEDRKGRPRAMIFDVGGNLPVEAFGADHAEGSTSYSFLDLANEQAGPRLGRWASAEREFEGWRNAAPEVFEGAPIDLKMLDQVVEHHAYLELEYIPWYSWNTVRYAPRCERPEVFQLYAQETNVNCAVATGQMILDFYKYHFNQTDIATAMNTGPGGTTNPNQVAGYESLSNSGLDATWDTSANWAEAKAEIDANRPVKSGIYGHARAVVGWWRQNIFILGSSRKRWLKVYDPSPMNSDICDGGAIYWEDWDSIFHTNWIYVRHS